ARRMDRQGRAADRRAGRGRRRVGAVRGVHRRGRHPRRRARGGVARAVAKKPRRLRPLRDEITDLPNLLTLARIATLPAVLLLIDNYSRILSFFSAFIFVIGGITDLLDGYLARKRGQETVLGAFLDPLADKLFVLGTL